MWKRRNQFALISHVFEVALLEVVQIAQRPLARRVELAGKHSHRFLLIDDTLLLSPIDGGYPS